MDSQSQDHPLLLELNSLKSAVARFQDEAHASAVKLQRYSLDTANTHERAVILERENDWLKAEITILRANPTPSPSNSSVEQVQQLTLSLRRLSEKLTLTEDALSSKTAELAQANADLLKARLAAENAYELAARVRGREEAVKVRETELQWRLKGAEEEKMISLVAVGEYANLVRSMEARMGLGSTSTLVSPDGTKGEGDPEKHYSGDTLSVALANSLVEGKLVLKRLLSEFHSDTEELHRQLGQLRGELEVVESNHEAERKGTHTLHLELAKAQAELHMLKIDDNTAAKMVSRYMQFSQTSTNNLQSTLSTLKTRHAATLSTLTSTSYSLASNLRSAENTVERLRTSLDELGRDIMKETYGRRREVALRVKLLGREQKMLEGLRRWLRKGEEAASDAENEAENSQSRAALLGMTQDARILLESLDDGLVTDSASLSGSLARVVLTQGLVDGLVEELKTETIRRMDLEKAILQGQVTSPPIVLLNDSDINQRPPVSDEQESSPNVSFPSTFLPHREVIPIHPPEPQLDEAQQSTADSASIDPIALDTPNLTTKDVPIPLASTGETVNAATVHSPLPFHPHQSDILTTNQVSNTVFFENAAAAESPPVDIQLTHSSSIPVRDTVIDADVARPPHIRAESPNSVIEEADIDKQSDSVVVRTDAAFKDMDLLVGTSSDPTVVEVGPRVELAIDDSVSSASPHSPSNQYSVGDPVFPSNPVTLSSSIPVRDTAIDADVAQPPHIRAEIPNSVIEEAGIDKQSDSVVVRTDVAFKDMDLLVGPSSVPTVVELGPQVELAIDDPVSSASPHSPSNLYSVKDPAVPSNPVTSLPTVPSTGQPPVLAEREEPKTSIPHPLLAELSKISHRYDDFQRSFRDCHLALEGLKASLGLSSSATSLNRQFNRPNGEKPPELTLTPTIPIDVLHAAVSRLDDYTEDVRVEVEIRISDEEVLAKGYEVLLCVPGALYSPFAPESSLFSPSLQANQPQNQLHHDHSQPPFSSQSYSDHGEDQDFNLKGSSSISPTQSELEIQVKAFIMGTDQSVIKACEGFSKKLEDVQHDIAVLKRTIHNPDPETIADGPELSSQTPTTPEGGGRGWASWIRSPSGPPFSASAATPSAKHFGGLGSTFGSIMTSPHRLNHSPSLNQSSNSATLVNGNGSSWMQGAGGGRRGGGRDDILGRLGLRVPMPIFDSAVHQPVLPLSSPSGWGWNGLSPTMPAPMKQRSVSSTMYMLGLGAPPMMTAARSRDTSNYSTVSQKGNDPAVAVNVGVESDDEMMSSRGPIGLVDVGRGDNLTSVGDETTDAETEEDEQDVEVE